MEKIKSAIDKARAEQAAAPLMIVPNVVPPVASGPSDVVQAWAALPVFVPKAAHLAERRVLTMAKQPEAVVFDVMRTKVLQQMRAQGWRRLAIASPTSGCGKSTVCLNLAFSLGRQPDLRTIVAELDLRRPALAEMLGMQVDTGFATVLGGKTALAQVARRCGSGLALALNADPVRHSAELLQGREVAAVLAQIEADYAPDILLFDMPPLLVSDDCMAFMPHVDAVLLIAGAETTSVAQIDACERELASQTNVMGVVLNKCRFVAKDSGYGSY